MTLTRFNSGIIRDLTDWLMLQLQEAMEAGRTLILRMPIMENTMIRKMMNLLKILT